MGNNECYEKDCMLKELMAYDFKLYDLVLYLDTHPYDQEALDIYQETQDMATELRAKYEEKYGPLTVNNAAGECMWEWINNPWPWEGGNC